MSAEPTGADHARLCHGRALRLDAGSAAAVARERPVWIEDVDAPADSPVARSWRDRELGRPLDPDTGPGLREVLLRYPDGTADLVTIGHRGAGGDPTGLAAALARIDAEPAPDWGLGDPSAGPAAGRHDFVGPTTGGEPAVTGPAALGLVLARYTGREAVAIGDADPRLAVVLRPDPTISVRSYLDRVRAAAPARDVAPLVGLTLTGAVAQRPFLAPVQPLSIHLGGAGGPVLRGTCWYRLRSFDPRIVAQFARHLVMAHHALVTTEPDTPLGEVDLFDAVARRQLAELGGLGRSTAARHERRIDLAVAAQAARAPDAIAVCCAGRRLTYGELDAAAERGAGALRAAGVRPGVRVGVCLPRSVDLIVVLLAVLKAGGAYVPMDPSHPADRLAFTVADAGLTLVVAAAGDDLGGVQVTTPRSLLAAGAGAVAARHLGTADDPAYVIYTSGSTGTPKGVVVPHRNVARLLDAAAAEFGPSDRDVWTMFHSPAFDFSVWEIWGCLMTGGRLVVVPSRVTRAPEEFAGLLAAERVTVLSQTPSAFGQLLEVDRTRRLPDSLRLVVFGGEPLDTAPLLPWFDRHPESVCRLVNMFGITETTVHVTAQTVTRGEAIAGSRSVGRPLPGWQVSVHDGAGRPVPPGVSGEIYVGGAGVADGYLNRPELTRQRFVPDPHTGATRYRSGDRGRLLPDGRLEHLGRLDDQVQLRGFRIELNEVRSNLLGAPGVTAATVVLRQPGPDAATAHLAAYVVLRGDGGGDTGPVREHVARFLPEHMVPATITALPALPLTANGKVDVARLPEPSRRRLDRPVSANGDAVAVDAAAERVLAVWEGVFGFRVGPDDDFFALGGNSLLAVRLSVALRGAGLPGVTVRQLYRHRTPGRLTAAVVGPQMEAV